MFILGSTFFFTHSAFAKMPCTHFRANHSDSAHVLGWDAGHILYYYALGWSGAFVEMVNINNCTHEAEPYNTGYVRKMFKRNQDSAILVPLSGSDVLDLNVHDGSFKKLFPFSGMGCSDAMLLDNRNLALVNLDESVVIWNYTSRKQLNTFLMEKYGHERTKHGNNIVQYTPNYNGTLLVWDTKTGNCTNQIPIPKPPRPDSWIVRMLSVDKDHIALGYYDGFMEIWDLNKHARIFATQAHHGYLRDLTKIDDNHFASGGNDLKIKIWDWKKGAVVWEHTAANAGFEINVIDGSRFAIAYQDGAVDIVNFGFSYPRSSDATN